MLPLRSKIPALCVSILLCSMPAAAQSSVNLAWDAATGTETPPTGYLLQWGTQPGIYTSSLDVGNRTTWTLTGLETDHRYYFTVLAYTGTGASRVYSPPSNQTANDALITQGIGTLPDDRPSIFGHNQVTGQLMTWHLNGPTVIDTRHVSIDGIPDTQWKVAGIGDLDGDGHRDILWRHQADGRLALWSLRNNQVIFTGYLSIRQMLDPAWRIGGVGDTDGDGYADIVWQHNDGRLAVWFMRGPTVVSTQYLSIPRMTNPTWRIVSVADVNGDRYADLIWEATDGWLAVWTLRGVTVQVTQYLSIPRMVDPNWKIQAAGAPDGTGVPALVWRHLITGNVAFWYLRGNVVTWTMQPTPKTVDDLNWKIVGSR
jgi:hypothetical protein